MPPPTRSGSGPVTITVIISIDYLSEVDQPVMQAADLSHRQALCAHQLGVAVDQ